MRLTFIKMDAGVLIYPDEADNATVYVEGEIQITYGHFIRDNDDHILAEMTDGFWTRPDGTHWSDVVIDQGEES